MKKKDRENVLWVIDNEGFDYAFRDYSDFEEIKDEKFHELRKKYIESAEALDKYIKEQK